MRFEFLKRSSSGTLKRAKQSERWQFASLFVAKMIPVMLAASPPITLMRRFLAIISLVGELLDACRSKNLNNNNNQTYHRE